MEKTVKVKVTFCARRLSSARATLQRRGQLWLVGNQHLQQLGEEGTILVKEVGWAVEHHLHSIKAKTYLSMCS